MHKSLLIVPNRTEYPICTDVTIDNIYKPISRYLRILRYIHFRLSILHKYKYIWYGGWKASLDKFEQIVVFDSLFGYEILSYIREKNYNIKIKLCYRNTINSKIAHSLYSRDPKFIDRGINVQLWSFDKGDCSRYNMKYYNQFFLNKAQIDIKDNNIYDVFFIGRDKGRIHKIKKLKSEFDKLNINTKIIVVSSEGLHHSQSDIEYLVKPIPYSQILNYVINSKCIVDLNQDGQVGLTYRPLEALFYKKKLITDNIDITAFDFYKEENIFILGMDDLSSLRDFISSSYVNIDDEIYSRYTFDYFVNSILK